MSFSIVILIFYFNSRLMLTGLARSNTLFQMSLYPSKNAWIIMTFDLATAERQKRLCWIVGMLKWVLNLQRS